MADIFELPSAWRGDLMPAQYGGAQFHVDAASRESGRRIVNHEFPKKDTNYAEDMGRKAREFTVRGYIIVFPFDGAADLQRLDYRPARDRLIEALESEGRATLQLPTLPPMIVVPQRYRLTEEKRSGGYCVFDMTFVEYGFPPTHGTQNSAAAVQDKADQMGTIVQQGIETAIPQLSSASRSFT